MVNYRHMDQISLMGFTYWTHQWDILPVEKVKFKLQTSIQIVKLTPKERRFYGRKEMNDVLVILKTVDVVRNALRNHFKCWAFF